MARRQLRPFPTVASRSSSSWTLVQPSKSFLPLPCAKIKRNFTSGTAIGRLHDTGRACWPSPHPSLCPTRPRSLIARSFSSGPCSGKFIQTLAATRRPISTSRTGHTSLGPSFNSYTTPKPFPPLLSFATSPIIHVLSRFNWIFVLRIDFVLFVIEFPGK